MAVILDTNFLLYVVKNKIDFVREIDKLCDFSYDLIIPKQVLDELHSISKGKDNKRKDKVAAELALQILGKIAEKDGILVIEAKGKNADDAIVNIVKKNHNKEVMVATMDKELKKRIKKINIISIRQGKYLEFI